MELYFCGLCEKVVPHSQGTITVENPFRCEDCKSPAIRTIKTESILKDDEISENIKVVDYHCKRCDLSFGNDDDLEKHIISHVRQENGLNCDMCDKWFNSRTKLNRHRRDQHRNRSYACQLCEKSFKTNQALKRHLARHYKSSKACQDRDCSFLAKGKDTDTKIHNHPCNLCDASFSTKYNLAKHGTLHMGESTYQCKVCEKSFAQKRELYGHTLVHEDEKPNKCTLCDEGFARVTELKKHLVSHTGRDLFQCSEVHSECRHENSFSKSLRRDPVQMSDLCHSVCREQCSCRPFH